MEAIDALARTKKLSLILEGVYRVKKIGEKAGQKLQYGSNRVPFA